MPSSSPLNLLTNFFRFFAGEMGDLLVRRPLYFLGRERLEIRHLFRGIERAPAVSIYTGVLWVIPLVMVNAYAAPYMVELGLSRAELGLYSAWAQGLSLLGFLTGGYLADTWGRKRTLVFFDITSWGLYTVCLTVAVNKWWCIAAILAMATNAGANIAYQILLVEGVKPYKRARVFTLLQLVNLLPSLAFLPLLGGLLVTKFGLIPAGRALYALFFLLFALGTWLRIKYLPDAPPPERAPASWLQALMEAWHRSREAFASLWSKPGGRPFLFARFIEEWKAFAWSTYSTLFLLEAVKVAKGDVALLAQGSAFVTFLVIVLIIPYIPVKRYMGLLGYEQFFALAAMALLLLARESDSRLLLSFLSSGLGAVAGALYWSANNAYWLSIMGDRERPKVVSAATGAMKLGVFLLGPLAAFLYVKVAPESLVIAMMALMILQIVLLRRVVREAPHAATAGA